jgi:DNA-binding MarR family transcriptional regulator
MPSKDELPAETVSAVDRQARQLAASFDTLATRMIHRRPFPAEANEEISIQELKTLGLLGFRGRTIMSALAEALGMPLSTATHTVDKLVRKGLVERARSEADRRVVEVNLSEEGKRRDRLFQDHRLAMIRYMLTALSDGEREIFLELIAKIALQTEPPATKPAPLPGEQSL